ncbi:MAG: glycosyltransferase family 39 protein [Lachnospiraceae bacterium]|nr:glycosyltransferase family 39 protein [Lachnospiraceae bacterium]
MGSTGSQKNRINNINKIKYLLAVVLLLYPLRHAFTGVDLMDAGYALGNYRFFDVLNPMWKLATYLANVTGVVLSYLPWGDTWAGMNIYSGLLVGVVAAAAFLYVCRLYEEKLRAGVFLFFLAEFTALSLCWAPNVILYHYLGYLLMTIAVLALYRAIIEDNKKGYITAGAILGLCIAVRMPNVTYMAFILPLWYFSILKKEKFGKLCSRTLYCVGGYALGLLVPLGIISMKYGISAYLSMITSLFEVTETATDYKPTSMLGAMFGDYARYSAWLGIFAVYGVLGVIAFRIIDAIHIEKNIKNKITIVIKALYLMGMPVLIRFCYGRGMFGFDYATEFFSIYKWVTVYLLLVMIACVWTLFSSKIQEDSKLWAAFLLVIIWITPLGSNNALHPIFNNLFLVAPISVYLFAQCLRTLKTDTTFRADRRFVIVSVCVMILLCTMVQSILFGYCFIFHDAGAATEQERLSELNCATVTSGLKTTPEKKQAIEGLDLYLHDSELNKKQVILYGDIPALAYILDMETAVFTTWADLDSNRLSLLERDLDALYQNGETPVVILGKEALQIRAQKGKTDAKLDAINVFIEASDYEMLYENSMFSVYH